MKGISLRGQLLRHSRSSRKLKFGLLLLDNKPVMTNSAFAKKAPLVSNSYHQAVLVHHDYVELQIKHKEKKTMLVIDKHKHNGKV